MATGPGISSWFVPTEFEERDGKPVAVTMNFGPGMESRSVITAWDPPRMFAAQGEGWGGSPPIADEWSVEARGGGICVVRVVHSLFASGDDWDNQLEGWEHGWPGFFRILRLYLTHFRGQRCSASQLGGVDSEPKSKTWAVLTGSLGLAGPTKGQQVRTPAGPPPLQTRTPEGDEAMKTISKPAVAGIAVLVAAAFPLGAGPRDKSGKPKTDGTTEKKQGYASVNGLKLYYEIHGTGRALVLLHGA